MLEARDLKKEYRTGAGRLPVLRGVSLRIEPGAFISITGPSGAGKSTLLHLLAGLDRPTGGDVFWNEQPLSRMNDEQRARFRNETIGIVFQFYHLLPELTALENVMLPGLVRRGGSGAQLRERATDCLKRVGLAGRLDHKPNALSGGELQRAAIARAIVNEPKLLLCDEPTGNLDTKTGAEIVELLTELHRRSGTGLVLVTHQPSLAEMAQTKIVLTDGTVVSHAVEGRLT